MSNILPLFPWIHIVDSTFHHLINQMVPLSLQNGKRVACSYRLEARKDLQTANKVCGFPVHPFFQERSSLVCLPKPTYRLANEQKDKLQDSIPVSASYVKNRKIYTTRQNTIRSSFLERKGPASFLLAGDS